MVISSHEIAHPYPDNFPFSLAFPLPSPSASYICERKINVPLELVSVLLMIGNSYAIATSTRAIPYWFY